MSASVGAAGAELSYNRRASRRCIGEPFCKEAVKADVGMPVEPLDCREGSSDASFATDAGMAPKKSGSLKKKDGTLDSVNVSLPVLCVTNSSSGSPSPVANTNDERVSSHT